VWIFFIFRSSKIRVSLTDIVSSLVPLRCRLSSNQRRHAAVPGHASFPLSQDELAVTASFSDNASSCRLPSRVETEILNLHHRRRPPFPDRPTLTLNYYKKSSQHWSLSPPLNRISILLPP
jgi:hypothetical protein